MNGTFSGGMLSDGMFSARTFCVDLLLYRKSQGREGDLTPEGKTRKEEEKQIEIGTKTKTKEYINVFHTSIFRSVFNLLRI